MSHFKEIICHATIKLAKRLFIYIRADTLNNWWLQLADNVSEFYNDIKSINTCSHSDK